VSAERSWAGQACERIHRSASQRTRAFGRVCCVTFQLPDCARAAPHARPAQPQPRARAAAAAASHLDVPAEEGVAHADVHHRVVDPRDQRRVPHQRRAQHRVHHAGAGRGRSQHARRPARAVAAALRLGDVGAVEDAELGGARRERTHVGHVGVDLVAKAARAIGQDRAAQVAGRAGGPIASLRFAAAAAAAAFGPVPRHARVVVVVVVGLGVQVAGDQLVVDWLAAAARPPLTVRAGRLRGGGGGRCAGGGGGV
jgi:hypothetical protein